MHPPVGPLPAAVYWRRRAGALAAVVVVLVLGVWGATAWGGGQGEPVAGTPPAPPTASSAPPPADPAPIASPPPPAPVATPSAAAPSAAPVAPAPPAPLPPGGCPDTVLLLQAQPASPTSPVGTEPEFRLLVANTGPAPCVVDVDASRQEVLVHLVDGVTRVWSSNDCYDTGSPDLRTLAPGEQLVFPVVWSGTSSAPGCAGERVPVLGGEFRLTVRLGALVSAPVPFSLV